MAFNVMRIYKLMMIFVFLGCLLAGRLFYLQIINGPLLTVQSLSGRFAERCL
ncbi:hypothetical protein HA075_23575 [bacterium BFN5]|nr:hypothetical protein HA075_23575 [bacterium BFN5]